MCKLLKIAKLSSGLKYEPRQRTDELELLNASILTWWHDRCLSSGPRVEIWQPPGFTQTGNVLIWSIEYFTMFELIAVI